MYSFLEFLLQLTKISLCSSRFFKKFENSWSDASVTQNQKESLIMLQDGMAKYSHL